MNGIRKEKLAKASLAKANTIQIEVLGDYENDRQKFNALIQDFGVTFDGNNNVLTNSTKSDINTNTTDIDTLEGYFSTTFTGDITVVTSVDFVGQTTTTSTISVSNGIITGIS